MVIRNAGLSLSAASLFLGCPLETVTGNLPLNGLTRESFLRTRQLQSDNVEPLPTIELGITDNQGMMLYIPNAYLINAIQRMVSEGDGGGSGSTADTYTSEKGGGNNRDTLYAPDGGSGYHTTPSPTGSSGGGLDNKPVTLYSFDKGGGENVDPDGVGGLDVGCDHEKDTQGGSTNTNHNPSLASVGTAGGGGGGGNVGGGIGGGGGGSGGGLGNNPGTGGGSGGGLGNKPDTGGGSGGGGSGGGDDNNPESPYTPSGASGGGGGKHGQGTPESNTDQ